MTPLILSVKSLRFRPAFETLRCDELGLARPALNCEQRRGGTIAGIWRRTQVEQRHREPGAAQLRPATTPWSGFAGEQPNRRRSGSAKLSDQACPDRKDCVRRVSFAAHPGCDSSLISDAGIPAFASPGKPSSLPSGLRWQTASETDDARTARLRSASTHRLG